MKRIPKDVSKALSDLTAKLRGAADSFTAAVEEFNAARSAAFAKVEAARAAYNELLASAEESRTLVVEAINDYTGARSDAWQSGETAERYADWLSQWESIDLDEVELEEPDALDVPDLGHADALDEPASELP